MESVSLDLPAFWVKSRDTLCAARLMSGLAGDGVPGIKSVALQLSPIGDWGPMGGDEIAGDPFPTEARWCLHAVSMLITLKAAIGGGDTDQLSISGRFLFQCVPVEVEGVSEWRLWKWWDETDRRAGAIPGGAAEKSLSEVKAYFAPPAPAYLSNDSPDHLMANLLLAWEALDPVGYAALLYDGSEAATDGEHYLPFSFYFDQAADPSLPVSWPCQDEQTCTETLLGEEPGEGLAGLRALAADFMGSGDWQAVTGGQVGEDPCPEDALWRAYDTNILMTLKATIAGGPSAFLVQDRAIVHCFPVQVGAGTEWRLWKWRDVATTRRVPASWRRVEDTTIGEIKVLYGP